jgi:hypothetical protein
MGCQYHHLQEQPSTVYRDDKDGPCSSSSYSNYYDGNDGVDKEFLPYREQLPTTKRRSFGTPRCRRWTTTTAAAAFCGLAATALLGGACLYSSSRRNCSFSSSWAPSSLLGSACTTTTYLWNSTSTTTTGDSGPGPAGQEEEEEGGGSSARGWTWSDVPADRKALRWQKCYDGRFDCARLDVPLDWLAPSEEANQRVVLAVIRATAKTQTDYRGPVFVNPGVSGLVIAEGDGQMAEGEAEDIGPELACSLSRRAAETGQIQRGGRMDRFEHFQCHGCTDADLYSLHVSRVLEAPVSRGSQKMALQIISRLSLGTIMYVDSPYYPAPSPFPKTYPFHALPYHLRKVLLEFDLISISV